MESLIGRETEIEVLDRLFQSKRAEFLAIYGRRRVGKTFLITQYFKGKGLFFEITGAPNASTQEQLSNFHEEFCSLFGKEKRPPKTWAEAFARLKNALQRISPSQKIVLFFDELPWLASTRSRFLQALDYNWNRHFSRMPNVLLIVCGSSAFWMVSQIINNKGGLYGRLSAHLRIAPFSLGTTEKYLKSRGLDLPRAQICEIYMITGGVPKYLSYLEPGQSAAQLIHSLCFTPQSPLVGEFYKLYHSLFKKPQLHFAIVQALAKKHYGLTRKELLKEAKLPNSGRTSEILTELIESGFISLQPEIGKQNREAHYYLSDEYSLFYLKWIEPVKTSILQGVDTNYWLQHQNTQSWKIWTGYAFENLCFKHLAKIKDALRIGGVITFAGYWKSIQKGKKESEIDLVIDRSDQSINLCEIKFHREPFEMDHSYAKEIERKREFFRKRTKTRKALFITLIASSGATKNSAYLSVVNNQVTLEDLF
jgi:AAA+ ATPase superfamily predicted ATPase